MNLAAAYEEKQVKMDNKVILIKGKMVIIKK